MMIRLADLAANEEDEWKNPDNGGWGRTCVVGSMP
jgi:hypothetical protein